MKTIKYLLALVAFLMVTQSINAHPSWGIVVDKDKNIYFADIAHNGMGSVWKLTNKGALILLLENFHAHNVSLDKEGNIITAHGENPYTLVKIKQNGSIDTLYHTEDYKDFFGGNCAWSASTGKIVYGLREHKYLRALDLNGNQKDIGDYQFIWNQTVYVSPEGTIYATEIGRDNGCIVKIDSNGKSSIIAKNLITKLDRKKDIHNDILLGITEGDDGHIYVAETAGKRIVKILSNGQNETFYKAEKNWMPTAIDFFSGEAYILEYNEGGELIGPRIVKIDKAGSSSVIFNYDTYEKSEILASGKKRNINMFFGISGLIIVAISIMIFLIRKREKLSLTNL